MGSDQKLGDFSFTLSRFPDLSKILDCFETKDFWESTQRQREERVHQLLLKLIQETDGPCFLLAAVSEFIACILQRNWLVSYAFSYFEFWLNHASGLPLQENYQVRAKIMGKYVPREVYQSIFPIGSGKFYAGSHYVTAHTSPDLDTTVASFWGWVDAFAAKVSEGIHIWNVPGGPPDSQVEIQFLFHHLLGKTCFEHFAKTRTSLSLSAVDLISKEKIVKKTGEKSIAQIDQEGDHAAVVFVDEKGYYLGDWRSLDQEEVMRVAILLHNCLRFFAICFHKKLTSLFSLSSLFAKDLLKEIEEIFCSRIDESEPVKEYTQKQRGQLDVYLQRVLQMPEGIKGRFKDLWRAMETIPLVAFSSFQEQVKALASSDLFDSSGRLMENRAKIFDSLEKMISALEEAVQSVKKHANSLKISFLTKEEVFSFEAQSVSYRADVEEIKGCMGSLPYLTVTMSDSCGGECALGIIRAVSIRKPLLGTVSLRDFCNRDETKIPPYFEVISVIDHHKSLLSTGAAPVAVIADAQSANSLVAEMAFIMHDKYSTAGLSLDLVVEQFAAERSSFQGRILQRLLQKQMILQRKQEYFIDPQREYLEYLHYLYAILDDTDLLSKVSYRDVLCVVSLLNRMKSLACKKEVEIISLDDIPQDEFFNTRAAQRILQNEDMYSLYRKIYEKKEEAVLRNLQLCIQQEPNNIFADTKVQNGCNRIGQTKLFGNNFPDYLEKAPQVRALWYGEAKRHQEKNPDCDLHIHMISTVPSADNVYAGREDLYEHQDELWIWIPQKEQAIQHLKSFLSVFHNSPQVIGAEMEAEFLGDNAKETEQIFQESFRSNLRKRLSQNERESVPVAILRYRAGLLNSRKAMISPYLPKLGN